MNRNEAFVGQKVKLKLEGRRAGYNSTMFQQEIVISKLKDDGMCWIKGEENGYEEDAYYEDLIIKNKVMSDIKTKFATMFLSEPKKTFRKAGITNGDNMLTEDGKTVFMGFLLEKFGDDFKKEVVDPMMKDDKESKE